MNEDTVQYDEIFAKCGACGRCSYTNTLTGEYLPCDCRYVLWNKVRYLCLSGIRPEPAVLPDGSYKVFYLLMNLSVFGHRLFSTSLKVGFRKWKIKLGHLWFDLLQKNLIEYDYD